MQSGKNHYYPVDHEFCVSPNVLIFKYSLFQSTKDIAGTAYAVVNFIINVCLYQDVVSMTWET